MELTKKEAEVLEIMAQVFSRHSQVLDERVKEIKSMDARQREIENEQALAKAVEDGKLYNNAVRDYFKPVIDGNPLFPITEEEYASGQLEPTGEAYRNLINLFGLPSHWSWADGSTRTMIEALCWFIAVADPRMGVASNGSSVTIMNDHVLTLTASDLYVELDQDGKYMSTPMNELIEQAKARLIAVKATRSQMG